MAHSLSPLLILESSDVRTIACIYLYLYRTWYWYMSYSQTTHFTASRISLSCRDASLFCNLSVQVQQERFARSSFCSSSDACHSLSRSRSTYTEGLEAGVTQDADPPRVAAQRGRLQQPLPLPPDNFAARQERLAMPLLCMPPYRSSGSHAQTQGPAFELVKAPTSRCSNLFPTSAANVSATPCHFAAQLSEPPAAKTIC